MNKNIVKMCSHTKKYLLWFAQEHLNFRFEEINSLLALFKIEMGFIETPNKTQPYWLVKFKSDDDVRLLTNRSVSLRSSMELWAYSDTIEDLHRDMKEFPYELLSPYMQENQSFKIEVETFCKHFTQKEKVGKLEVDRFYFVVKFKILNKLGF